MKGCCMNRYSKKDVDWDFWQNMPHAMAWQACALSLNIDPDSMKHSGSGWMAGPGRGPFFEPSSFPSKDVADQFDKRLRLLSARITKFHLHSINQARSRCEIYLSEFAAWAVSEMKWDGLPPELVALTQEQDKQAEAAPVTRPMDDEQTNPADHAQTLAALFDPVPVEALEKMFPSSGKWKTWAEKAKANGLIDAREGTAKFNPYKAGAWFVHKGAEGWDTDRLYQRLARNLPPRSRDSAHLLTGDFE